MSRKRRTAADEPYMVVRTSSADLADGGAIASHTHDWHQLIYVRSGLMTVRTGAGTWVAPPSWAIWVPAGVLHAIRFTGRSTLRTCYLRPDQTQPADERSSKPADHGNKPSEPDGESRQPDGESHEPDGKSHEPDGKSRQPDGSPTRRRDAMPSDQGVGMPVTCAALAVSPLLRELILRVTTVGMLDSRVPTEAAIATLIVSELGETGPPPAVLPEPTTPATIQAAALISSGAPASAGTATLARAVGLSTRTLERRFHAETGLTLGRWRQQYLLLHGLELLAAGAPTGTASAAAGYNSASAFIAAFRKTFGTTPARYITPP